jgi:hypothetical protein
VPVGLGSGEGKGKEYDCEGRLFAPVCRTSSSGHTWSVRSVTASGPQSRPCLPRPHARPSQRPMESARRWSAGVTGENSPHHTNLSMKRKIDRLLAKYFFRSTEMAKTGANDRTEENSTRAWNALSQRMLIAPSLCPPFAKVRPQQSNRQNGGFRNGENLRNLWSGPEQIELLRPAAGGLSGDAAQPIEQALDAVVHGGRGMAATASEFGGPDPFELELSEKSAFLFR